MNNRLINEFIQQAANAPEGTRMHVLIALVANHCAIICEIDPKFAAQTIRDAFTARVPQMKPVAAAACEVVK
jgi:hypothetical protein